MIVQNNPSFNEEEMIANLDQWFNAAYRYVTLPSGLKVKLKVGTLTDLVVGGYVSIPLVQEYDKAKDEYISAVGEAETIEAASKLLPMYEAVCLATMIFPKIGKTLDISKGIITINDLSIEDKVEIYKQATMGFSLLDKFREESTTTPSVS